MQSLVTDKVLFDKIFWMLGLRIFTVQPYVHYAKLLSEPELLYAVMHMALVETGNNFTIYGLFYNREFQQS